MQHSTTNLEKELRGFGVAGLGAMLLILVANLITVVLAAALVVFWANLSATSLAALGFNRPKHWVKLLVAGAIAGIFLKLLLKLILMPYLGAPAVNSSYHYLAGNTAEALWMIPKIILSAGIAEEIVYRGWLFERLGKIWGRSHASQILTILISSILFAAAHLADQGVYGAAQAAITGLVFGALFARTRNIYLVMIVHIFFDLAALAMIYWDLELFFAGGIIQ